MDEKLLKPYDPKETEGRIYKLWEKSGYFNPDNLPGKRSKKFVVMIAPPNITGSLHLGHALENTISDILVRYHRMCGYKTLWLPGTDHAGIATQNVVEKELKKQNLTRHDLGREKFIEKVWEWKEKYGGIILDQLKKMGFSLDWSRLRFTMDPDYQEAVKAAFAHYHKKGLIYQGERVINWCIKDQTALSDLELEYAEEKAKLWYFKYPLKNSDKFIIVATTRPETMLGDTAVAVNPKDKRYSALIGEKVVLPITGREIPIINDEKVEVEFGTGAVKVTPAHDLADSDMAERHKLPYLKVISEVGKIVNVSPEFDGLKILEARERVVGKFKEAGLLEKEEDLTHNVAKCYRCGGTVEPLLSKQWFLKMKPLAEKALKAIKSGEVVYEPERWKDLVVDWLQNIRDWCISRQIWWGHKIPIEGEDSVLDTWFSSALWPLATLGWPKKTSDFKKFYPTEVITSARDIIHLWISRMIFSGLEFADEAPFKEVIIHATVLAKDGKRMSKSLGTGIDPMGLVEKHGADATRFGLIWQNMGTQDIRWGEEAVLAGKKFSNKLWNITRFILEKTDGKISDILPKGFKAGDSETKNILKQFEETKDSVKNSVDKHKFGEALHTLYDFIWRELADKYIEHSKKTTDESEKVALGYILSNTLKLLHPFMPFVTEEIWSLLPKKEKELLIIAPWPK